MPMTKQRQQQPFSNHWEKRKVIYSTLDMMDSTEQTSPAQFRLALTGVLRGFLDSRNIQSDAASLDGAMAKLRSYADRPRAKAYTQSRMERFLSLLDAGETKADDGLDSRDSPIPRPTIMIRLTGMSQRNIDSLVNLGPAEYGFRLYLSEANEGLGILVFDDDQAHELFTERFFRENPCISPQIWHHIT
jgi:hypothetical protein